MRSSSARFILSTCTSRSSGPRALRLGTPAAARSQSSPIVAPAATAWQAGSLDVDAADDLIGRVLGSYRIERMLGEGGMGAVYVATHVRTGRPYAVKVLLPELAVRRDAIARFRREAEAIGALGHANVVAIHDFDVTDGLAYLVMELLEGEDLATRLERVGVVPIDDVLRIVDEVAA